MIYARYQIRHWFESQHNRRVAAKRNVTESIRREIFMRKSILIALLAASTALAQAVAAPSIAKVLNRAELDDCYHVQTAFCCLIFAGRTRSQRTAGQRHAAEIRTTQAGG
jgi:uncharacterized membrane protein